MNYIMALLVAMLCNTVHSAPTRTTTKRRAPYPFTAHINSENAQYLANRHQKPFVFVICSYNNEEYVEANLRSALEQKYKNFRIIYCNDCSRDKTLENVQRIKRDHKEGSRITILNNEVRQGALQNIYEVITDHCHDKEIVVMYDGDDSLADENVLMRLNYVYSNPEFEVWLTYGQFRELNSGAPGFCKPMPQNIIQTAAFRRWPDAPSHLRTFYAWLFKRIKREDLMRDGEFFPMTYDLAMMFPMIEMARHHFQFIPDVLYIYNDSNPISDHRVNKNLQREIDIYIRGLPRYDAVLEAPIRRPDLNHMKKLWQQPVAQKNSSSR